MPLPVTVEVIVMGGSNYFIVGCCDSAVKESLQRVESAIKTKCLRHATYQVGGVRPLIDIRKKGSAFDLAIAIGNWLPEQLLQTDKLSGVHHHGRIELTAPSNPLRALPIAIASMVGRF